jgi:hypothetical protein
VVSEVIDGEAIIMDLRSGNYFSADGVGARVWAAIDQGHRRDAILAWMAASFDGDEAKMAEGLDAFIAQLTEHGLIEPRDPADPAPSAPSLAPEAERTPFRLPVVSIYTDMQDLLLLDPIHDVDEQGWPTRKTDEPPA